MDKQQFIINTIKPYLLDPSKCAFKVDPFEDEDEDMASPIKCLYRTKDGLKCALGQHIRDEAYDIRMEESNASDVLKEFGHDILTEEADEMGFDGPQWDTIQRVHDKIAGAYKKETFNAIVRECETACNVDLGELKELYKNK